MPPKCEDYDDVPPNASGLIESMRAHGYTLPTAIADIIDNSIAADSANIWLNLQWESGNPWISITDDGSGMGEEELRKAMTLASISPLVDRKPFDLGRFGLGLKTASFSQARRLTVVSKTKMTSYAVRRWDLDHLAKPSVKGWQLLKSVHPKTGRKIEELKKRKRKSGTVVLLEELDRLFNSNRKGDISTAEKHWVNEVERVRQHLAMVFHRFLSDPSKKGLEIWLNESKIGPWDPFCESVKATQSIASDPEIFKKRKIETKGYILPHRDSFDPKDKTRSAKLHQAAAGPAGWNAQQGFYLYRNKRLIIPGDWLGLGPGQHGWKKEEHYKLARIRVDIPNSMDHEWQIDVKKSTAIAPPALKAWLTGLAKTTREKAKEVYAHRGGRPGRKSRQKKDMSQLWLTKRNADETFNYCIDRKHELFSALLEVFTDEQKKDLETLLRLIEETVPVQRIWIDTADNQEGVLAPFENESDAKLKKHILICYEALMSSGLKSNAAWDEIAAFPAFQTQNAKALIGHLIES